jgi:SAM-dependent methyltransferase
VGHDIFGPLHAGWYDRWHEHKDYPAEVAQIEEILLKEVLDKEGPAPSVIDLGCGTARHLERLAAAGHEVLGVDRSPVMVEQAKARLARYGDRASVVQSDLLDVTVDRPFDAAIMMFSVLGYQTGNDELLAALATVHRAVRPGGLFLFDILDATVVLREGPKGGVTVVHDGDHHLLRATTGKLFPQEQVYELGMQLWLMCGNRVLDCVKESHRLRYFLRRELELALGMTGFRSLGSAPLAGGQSGPSREWSRLVWARRI